MIIERDGSVIYEMVQDGVMDGEPHYVKRWFARIFSYRDNLPESEAVQIAAMLQVAPALKAACETLLACDRETDPGTGLALLQQAVEQARAALKLCMVQQ